MEWPFASARRSRAVPVQKKVENTTKKATRMH